MNLRAKDKLVVGLTGSILSGKSTALSYFARNGAGVISADELVRQLYQAPAVQKQITRWFGSCKPAEVARCVFADEPARRKLEKYLHPKVWALAAKQIKQAPQPIIVFEVPLLFETGWNRKTDLTITLLGDERTLPARLKARGLTLAEYKRRVAGQLPESEKVRRADIVLANRGSKTDLGLKIKRLCQALNTIYALK